MEIIKLNLIPSGVNPTCHCSQYDEGRVIRIELFDGLTPYTLQSGDTVTLNVRKPDNTIVTTTVETTQGNNYVDIVTTEQICACVGYNLCDLTITNGSKVIGTLNFIMAIERDVLADGIPSQSVIEDLDELVQEAVGDNYYTKTEVDTALSGKASTSEVNTLSVSTNELNDLFIHSQNVIELADFQSGYINNSGVVTAQVGVQYTSVNITSDLIGKTLYISGTAWWSIKPFVFVGTEVIPANVPSPSETVTQYTDLPFVPTETGTLYINKYDMGSVHNIANAFTIKATEIKEEALPNPLPVKDNNKFIDVELTLINKKILNGETGVITDTDQAIYYISDFTEVSENGKIALTTQMHWAQGLFAFYDSNKIFISGRKASSGSTETRLYNEIIDVPENAKYIVIGFLIQLKWFATPFLSVSVERNALPSNKWKNIKWCCIGDSLTAYNTKTSKRYFDYIAENTGITVINLGVSGTGYASGNSNFMTVAQNAPVDSDVITIFGSFNDLGAHLPIGTVDDTTTTTLAGCINTTITNLQTRIPLVNLGIISPTPWDTTQPSTSGNAYNYVEMLKAICARRSIPFLDLWRESNLRPWDADFRAVAYSKDGGSGTHPDENGHKLFAPRFKAFLETLLL